MKIFRHQLSAIILSTLLLTGCSGYVPRYQGTRTALQPGDAIIFKGTNANTRANAFRGKSLNDLKHTSNVVEITRPTTIVNE